MRRPNNSPVIAGMLVSKDPYNLLIAEMIDLLRKGILKVERIPPEDPKNKKIQYYHNYKYFILSHNINDLLPYEKFIIEFIKKYKDPSKEFITHEELEKKAESDAEFKNIVEKWDNIIYEELNSNHYIDAEDFKKKKKKNNKLTLKATERESEWRQYRKYFNMVGRKDFSQRDIPIWEDHLTYAVSFDCQGDGEKINQIMDKIFPTQEERKKSHLYIEGIEGNDDFFSEFTFFAPIDFGINFADFLCIASKR